MKMYGIEVTPLTCGICGGDMTIGHFAADTKNPGKWYWACIKAQNSNECDGFVEIEKDKLDGIPPELQREILETDDERRTQVFR